MALNFALKFSSTDKVTRWISMQHTFHTKYVISFMAYSYFYSPAFILILMVCINNYHLFIVTISILCTFPRILLKSKYIVLRCLSLEMVRYVDISIKEVILCKIILIRDGKPYHLIVSNPNICDIWIQRSAK